MNIVKNLPLQNIELNKGFALKEIEQSDGKDVYDMFQEIPKVELGSENIANQGLGGRSYRNMTIIRAISEIEVENILRNPAYKKYCSTCNALVSKYMRKKQKGVRKRDLLCEYCHIIKKEDK